MSYDVLDVRPMTKRIGAEIFGVDLSQPLTNKVTDELHNALMEHQVIFFRDQPMTYDSLKRAGRSFGDLAMHSGVSGMPEHPEIVTIHADANSKFIAGEDWHSDLSEDPEPPMGSILYMHELPPVGGDTLFASMYAAYDGLSEPLKRLLEGMTAIHRGEHVYRGTYGVDDRNRVYPEAEHPVIRTHPVSGRPALFVNRGFTTRIVQLKRDESAAVLEMLYRHIETPEYQCRFRWQPRSIAFWDNRCVQHHAMWDYFPQRRHGHRVTISGEKPFDRS